MTALRIATRAECVNREGANLWRKLDHADVRAAGDTVATLLSVDWRSVDGEHSSIVAIHAADREAWFSVLKVFVLTFVDTLQAVKFAPRNFPRAEVTLKRVDNFGKR